MVIATKQSTSPTTKIFVSHVRLMIECSSPPTIEMIRPSIMYMDAANKGAASRRRMVDSTYGSSVQ